MRKKVLLVLLIPSLVFASIGDDLNHLFQEYFGSGQEPIEEEIQSPLSPPPEDKENSSFDIPDIDIPEHPTEDDLTDLRKQIFTEENSLEDFRRKLEKQEADLWKVKEKENSVKMQLTQLDTQIGINRKKLKYYKNLEKKWKDILEAVTEQKSEIKAELQIRKEAYERFMQRNFIRNQYFGGNQDISIIRWLLSDRKISEILEEKQIERQKKRQQQAYLKKLKTLKKKLDDEERQSALLYGRIARLHRAIAQEKINLQDMADGKARLLENLTASKEQIQNMIKVYSEQKNQSAIYLQNLHQALKKTGIKIDENITNNTPNTKTQAFFRFPLKIPIKITASFRDPDYEKRFGRVHNAVDFFAPQGTDLFAPADGVVEKVGLNNFGYSYLILKHKNGFFTVYGHLSQILLQKDQKIKVGELIGKTGGTPGTKGAGYFTTGPHLHFEVFKDGHYKNPLDYLPPVKS